jgi:hypothetical protein
MKEKTLKDVIENTRSNWYGEGEEEESEMNVDTGQAIQGSFKSFCSRMYLDYSDETSDPYSERLEKKDYIAKYKDWLRKQFIDKKGIV